MSDTSSKLASLLKQSGHSMTIQRKAIFELLQGQDPLTMAELVTRAAPRMDRASVYRTVELFEALGIIRRINIGWKYKLELSDAFAEHHHHLTCLGCQAIIPINEQALESFVETLAEANHFTPVEHQIEIQGYCQRCHATPTLSK